MTSEEKAEVERFREEFQRNRFKTKQSADLLMQMEVQFRNCISHFSPHLSSTLVAIRYIPHTKKRKKKKK